MYALWVTWELTHRAWIAGGVALILWIAAYGTFLQYDVRAYFNRRKPARWGVDMAARKITSGRKPLV